MFAAALDVPHRLQRPFEHRVHGVGVLVEDFCPPDRHHDDVLADVVGGASEVSTDDADSKGDSGKGAAVFGTCSPA